MNAKEIVTIGFGTVTPDRIVKYADLLRAITEGVRGRSGVIEYLGRAVPLPQGFAAMRASGR
nr:hypothetical protein [Mesorhizobium sp.]